MDGWRRSEAMADDGLKNCAQRLGTERKQIYGRAEEKDS